MTQHKRHGLWLINILLLLAVAAAWWLQRQPEPLSAGQHGLPNLAALSHLIDDRVGKRLPLDLFEAQLFAGGSSVKREYRSSVDPTAAPIWLLAVQTFNDRHAHHPPEYCYTGSGWQVENSAPAPWALDNGEHPMQATVSLDVDGTTRRELVAYWFTDGHRFAASYFKRVLLDAWDRITDKRSSWIMMRVSMPLDADADSTARQGQLADFSRRVENLLEASTG